MKAHNFFPGSKYHEVVDEIARKYSESEKIIIKKKSF